MSNQLDVTGLAALLGLFVPLVVAVVTKKWAAPIVKSICNVVGSVVAAVVAVWANANGHITGWLVFNTVVTSLVVSVSAYKGFWKSANISNWTAPAVGLGKRVAVKEQPGAYTGQQVN